MPEKDAALSEKDFSLSETDKNGQSSNDVPTGVSNGMSLMSTRFSTPLASETPHLIGAGSIPIVKIS